jgi:hypothetical protein
MTYSLRSAWALAWSSGLMSGLKTTWVKAFTVAQVHENDTAVVPAALDPAHEDHFEALFGGTQLIAVVGSSHVAQDVSQCLLLLLFILQRARR